MRLTAKEAATILGVSDRTVRLKLARGQLKGVKLPDPTTGADTWFVDLPDEKIRPPAGSDPTPLWIGPGPGSPYAGKPSIPWQLHQEMIEKLHRENLELAGRCGYLQARVQDLEASNTRLLERIALLDAPNVELSEIGNRPISGQNGQDSGTQTVSETLEEQLEAGRESGASAPPAANGKEGSLGGPLKRFWCWLTQPV